MNPLALLLVLVVASPPAGDQAWTWIAFPETRQHPGGDSYADVLSHLHEPFKSFGDRATTAHELVHGIHSHLRNKVAGKGKAGFYLGRNAAVIIPQPKCKLADVADMVPGVLRGSRFNTYLVRQRQYFANEPLYIFDEWIAYCWGGCVLLDDAAKGAAPRERTDLIHACAEFLPYGIALGQAVEKHDPAAFDHPQFRSFLAWQLKRSASIYRAGQRYRHLQWQGNPLEKLRDSAEAQAQRSFLDRLGLPVAELTK